MKKEEDNFRANRKKWWRNYIHFKRKNKKKASKFIYLGKEPVDGAIVLCNHEGTNCPRMIEWWYPRDYRFWGAYEMNSGMRSMSNYLRNVFYPLKKRWKKFPSQVVGFLGTPITTVIYKGLHLISIYKDMRFKTTIEESIETLKANQSIIIFPEDSTNGYQKVLQGFHPGFVALMQIAYTRHNMDLPIQVMYWHRATNTFVVDENIYMTSELLKKFNNDKEAICKFLCDRCNHCGSIDTVNYKKEEK